jgi:hypothetical protein
VRLAEGLAGSDTVARLGSWEVEGDSIYAASRRGWLEYELTAPAADIYRIEIEGASRNPFDLDSGFYLVLSVDGESLGRVLLDAGPGRVGTVQALTPWLEAGPHRLRVFWDNVRKGRSLQVNAVRLQTLLGPDANNNGIKDWVEDKLARENGIELVAQIPGTIDATLASPSTAISEPEIVSFSSFTSPACLEGRGGFLSMMKIRLSDGQEIQPKPGAGDRWYANVPLSPDEDTDVEVSFQNGARVEKCRIAWRPVNVLASEDLLIRQGDALLLGVGEGHRNLPEAAHRTMEVKVGGAKKISGPASAPSAHRFETAGTFEIVGSVAGSDIASQKRTMTVGVVGGFFDDSPVAWVGRKRSWHCPSLSKDAPVSFHSCLTLEEAVAASPTGRSFSVLVNRPEDHHVLARLQANGPVLASAAVRGLDIYGVSESGAFYVKEYDDGSRLVETAVAPSRIFSDVQVQFRIIVAGVMFEDGALVKVLQPDDFDETGLALVHFIMPPGVQTSNCHIMRAYQNGAYLGEY